LTISNNLALTCTAAHLIMRRYKQSPTPMALKLSCFSKALEEWKCFNIADAAFQVSDVMLTPYRGNGKSKEQVQYNYSVSTRRQVIERAFGLLVRRWRLMKNTFQTAAHNGVCLPHYALSCTIIVWMRTMTEMNCWMICRAKSGIQSGTQCRDNQMI
jgi:hypothetical protein